MFMKRLFYLLLFFCSITVFASCSSQDDFNEITVEIPRQALEAKEEKEPVTTNDASQPARDPVPSKSPF